MRLDVSAIAGLLELLALDGCTVPIDALGCQTAIAQQSVDGGTDDALALNANRERPHREVVRLFAGAEGAALVGGDHDRHERLEKGHGRMERRRRTTIISDPAWLGRFDEAGERPRLGSLIRVEGGRRVPDPTGERVSRETGSVRIPPDQAFLP